MCRPELPGGVPSREHPRCTGLGGHGCLVSTLPFEIRETSFEFPEPQESEEPEQRSDADEREHE